ncbi:MAG: ribosome maturation factor RimM [Xanthomonadales bacterium]|nr:ribosome maturation factor RimM [Xanthomonadales bacterium]
MAGDLNKKDASLDERVLLGHVAGVHGVKGWVKIHSYTDPRNAIFDYQPWLLEKSGKSLTVLEGKISGKYLLVRLKEVSSRDEAEALAGQKIAVVRDGLPPLLDSEFYWADLVGLEVLNQDGSGLGHIREMLATGANDVMVVSGERERLIPFVLGLYVSQVDLEQGVVKVDWDPEF